MLNPLPYSERDLANTPRENAAPQKSLLRSFSFSKKKKKTQAPKPAAAAPRTTEVTAVVLTREQADTELGLDIHAVTGDIIVSYVGMSLADAISVGDTILTIHGQEVFHPMEEEGLESDLDDLGFARHLLREPAESVEMTMEKYSVRTEVLTRRAALKGTSLDKLGMTLGIDEGSSNGIIIEGTDGLAAKSGRILIGDKLISINGTPVTGLQHCVDLLTAEDLGLEVLLELTYGYLPPKDHEFDPVSGSFVPYVPKKQPGVVRRSLSFGRKSRGWKKKEAVEPATKKLPAAEDVSEADGIPEIDTEVRMLSIEKNAEGKICVTFKIHPVTGELMIGLVGAESPASRAGVEVGDRVLALGSHASGCEFFDEGGQVDFEKARDILLACKDDPILEIAVQKRIRTEVMEFGYAPEGPIGGPKDVLGMTFHSEKGDKAVRVIGLVGAAAKSGRMALGDQIMSINGIRVNHAETLSDLIREEGRCSDTVELEVLLGYQAAEGLWFGTEMPNKPDEPRKAKRSFSFGRKPKH